MENYASQFHGIKGKGSDKGLTYNNPLITQEYGADPYAMVYENTLYIYMTQDAYERDGAGNIKENSYATIKSIRVISTKDGVNWTDHGAINVAGSAGAAKWARNSWAPAVAWKHINGKNWFFLYFADSGGGIGVLKAESPIGPFKDPLGHGLITKSTKNCKDVLWLFDPAVLVDDNGRAYIYFGGGVPQDKIAHPKTARVAELSADMIGLKSDPVIIDAPYLFEDSGIHKVGNKYYYTYCTNWQVDEGGAKKYGFTKAQIVSMESNSPMGPFVLKETILENPGKMFGLYGNNHHCVFQWRNQWYITYHTRVLEQTRGIEKGYRCTFINSFTMGRNGTIGMIRQNKEGIQQLSTLDPYTKVNACTFSHQAGLAVAASDSISAHYGTGNMVLTGIDTGDFCRITGADFKWWGPSAITMTVRKIGKVDEKCAIELRLDVLNGQVIGYIPVGKLINQRQNGGEFAPITAQIKEKIYGKHDFYMNFSGSNYEILDWKFEGELHR